MYPASSPANAIAVDRSDLALSGEAVISADASGFIVTIDEQSILRHAVHHRCTVEITAAGGKHVLVGDELARVRSGEATAELIAAVRKCFSLGDARNPHQDIDFAVQQLTEMAVRALSPSTNDPYTAKNALAELAVGLVPLVQRNAIPEGRADEHGTLRLLVHRTAPATVVDTVFDAMRIYAVPSPVAVTATIDLARRVGAAAPVSTDSGRTTASTDASRERHILRRVPDLRTSKRVRSRSMRHGRSSNPLARRSDWIGAILRCRT